MRTQAEWNVDTHIFSATGPDQSADPLLHLVGGLVGERDGQDLERRDALAPDQVGDAVGEHPGLARARAGDDQQRPAVWVTASRCAGFSPSSRSSDGSAAGISFTLPAGGDSFGVRETPTGCVANHRDAETRAGAR